jgi:hypothetical protein
MNIFRRLLLILPLCLDTVLVGLGETEMHSDRGKIAGPTSDYLETPLSFVFYEMACCLRIRG